jgi:hypothetical protein
MDAHEIIAVVGELITLFGVVVAVFLNMSKVIDGQKCLLRSEMLHIYYKHQAEQMIRQYENENFIMLYEAYKKLNGNSFIDKVYEEVQKWKVIS